jgi:uncharacterized phage protein (TIGR01671 family)|nr:MAG TPA: YopX protein [Caudoviricetes sp.]
MREILFKAKRIDNDEWVEGCLVIDHSRSNLFEYRMKPVESGILYAPPINPETLCQFTGLCDRYGNKIWENDIVTCQTRYGGDIGKVVFHSGKFCVLWNSTYHYSRNGKCENYYDINTKNSVKGNVFDNPELLQEEHK